MVSYPGVSLPTSAQEEADHCAVRDTTLAQLDARLMLTGSETALHMARALQLESNAFNVDEYLIRYVYLIQWALTTPGHGG